MTNNEAKIAESEWLTVADLVRWSGVSRPRVQNEIRNGRIKIRYLSNGLTNIRAADALEWKASYQAPIEKHSKNRNQSIYEERQSGKTFASIGRDHNISGGRVREICAKIERNLRSKDSREAALQRRQARNNRSRPIDMGGRRDVDFAWTPEMQAREFGLVP